MSLGLRYSQTISQGLTILGWFTLALLILAGGMRWLPFPLGCLALGLVLGTAETNVYTMYALIPVTASLQAADGSFSYGIVLFMLAFLLHLMKRAAFIRVRPCYLLGIALILVLEWFHTTPGFESMMVFIRWAMLVGYGCLLFIDEEFHLDVDRMTWHLLVGIALSILCGVFLDVRVKTVHMALESVGRFPGGMGDPNTFAAICALPIAVQVGAFIAGRHRHPWGLLGALGCGIAGAATYSRTFMVSMVLLAACFLLALFRPRTMRVWMSLGVAAMGFAVAVWLSIQRGAFFMATYATRWSTPGGSGSRDQLVLAYLERLKDKPALLWFGSGAFKYMTTLGMSLGVHNTFVEIILAWGLFGFLLVGVIGVGFLRSDHRACGWPRLTILSMAPFIPLICFLVTLQFSTLFFTLFLLSLASKSAYMLALSERSTA